MSAVISNVEVGARLVAAVRRLARLGMIEAHRAEVWIGRLTALGDGRLVYTEETFNSMLDQFLDLGKEKPGEKK